VTEKRTPKNIEKEKQRKNKDEASPDTVQFDSGSRL